jgi:hypothetical protein
MHRAVQSRVSCRAHALPPPPLPSPPLASLTLVHERRLADVWVAADEQRPGVWVDGRQAAQVLAHLLQVGQRGALALHQGAHAAQGGALERLAAVERVAVLEQAHVVLGHRVDEAARGVELAQRQLVVVLVVEDVHEVGVEGVHVVHLGEVLQDERQPVVPVAGRELDLAHIELADALDGPACGQGVGGLGGWDAAQGQEREQGAAGTAPGGGMHPKAGQQGRCWRRVLAANTGHGKTTSSFPSHALTIVHHGGRLPLGL